MTCPHGAANHSRGDGMQKQSSPANSQFLLDFTVGEVCIRILTVGEVCIRILGPPTSSIHPPSTPTHTHTRTNTHARTCTHARERARTHAQTHARTHTHTQRQRQRKRQRQRQTHTHKESKPQGVSTLQPFSHKFTAASNVTHSELSALMTQLHRTTPASRPLLLPATRRERATQTDKLASASMPSPCPAASRGEGRRTQRDNVVIARGPPGEKSKVTTERHFRSRCA